MKKLDWVTVLIADPPPANSTTAHITFCLDLNSLFPKSGITAVTFDQTVQYEEIKIMI